MNLTLSRKADYVMRAAIALARNYEGAKMLKVREIAGEMAIPRSYTPQILDSLIQAGLVDSKAGKSGGYRLCRDPAEISVLEIIEAGEGPLKPATCALSDGPCRWDAVCPLHSLMSHAVSEFQQALGNESLAELALRDMGLERGQTPVPLDSHRHMALSEYYPVSDFIHIELPVKSLGEAISANDGEGLAPLFCLAAQQSIAELQSQESSLTQIQGDSVVVNLGVIHVADSTIKIPLVVEPLSKPSSAPRFVGTLTATAIDNNRSMVELEGRLEYDHCPMEIFTRQTPSAGVKSATESIKMLSASLARRFLRELAATAEMHLQQG
ncbi:MAG: RrF2 family transcriptional regulator [Ferrimicrobium sp.]